jgi:hypothetical protein
MSSEDNEKTTEVSHDGNVQVVLPGGLQVSFGSSGSAAIAHVEPEHAQFKPVVIEQCIRHALTSVRSGSRLYLKYGIT